MPHWRRPGKRPSSRFIPAHHTVSTPSIVQAIARKPPKMHGVRCRPGSRNTRCSADRHNPLKARGATAHDCQSSGGAVLDWTAFGENAVSLSEAIAVAMRFGHLLDFPEHPHKGRAQADDDASSVRPGAVSMLTIREAMQTN